MRIGVDAACWSNGRGYGRFVRELLRHMVSEATDDEFICFVDPWTAKVFDLRAPNVRMVSVRLSAAPSRAAAADGYRTPLDMFRLTRAVAREELDVFFSPSVYTYFPLPPHLAAVVCVHDAIADRHPELTLASTRARLFWRAKVKLALLQARLVLTVSDFAAREITEVLGVDETSIRVTWEAPAASYLPSEEPAEIAAAVERIGLAPGSRWFVYVGGFNPHKHVPSLIRAHAAVSAGRAETAPHLLLVGDAGADVFHQSVAAIRDAITAAGTETLVHWLGFVPDEELRHLHSGAVGLILPSENEGFGLPAVEAAACGAPVVATNKSPLPQLLEGGGIFVSPGDEQALAAALRTLLDDEPTRARMGARARQQASRLSWGRSAHAALRALREAAA